jgi:uncharacterized protein with gpF-like domain
MHNKPHSSEAKLKISNAKKGKPSWNKGIPCSEETKKKLSLANKNPSFKNMRKKVQSAVWKNEKYRKHMSDAHKGQHSSPKTQFKKGQIAWNFNNYSSFEPYGKEFNEELKEKIRKKYNYRCQECFRHQNELYRKGKKYSLFIHHIDFNKKNNAENNLIPLCNECHSQTNFNRENWIEHFQGRVI